MDQRQHLYRVTLYYPKTPVFYVVAADEAAAARAAEAACRETPPANAADRFEPRAEAVTLFAWNGDDPPTDKFGINQLGGELLWTEPQRVTP